MHTHCSVSIYCRSGEMEPRGVEKKSNSLFGSASCCDYANLKSNTLRRSTFFAIGFFLYSLFAVTLFPCQLTTVCVCEFFIFFYNPDSSPSYAHSHLHTHTHTYTHIHSHIYVRALPARACLAQSLSKISICRRVANVADINFKKNEN